MRQALMIGARPTFSENKEFPRVPLGAGNWKFLMENHKNSLVTVKLERDTEETITLEGVPGIFEGPMYATACIKERGTESYVNVFAELVK